MPCDPENGHKRVDTYNTFALDYIVQQGPLREGYVDWLATDAITARFGRFILPVGFAPREVGSWTAKDMTRIQRLNAEANFGLMLAVTRAARRSTVFGAMGVLGEGNREKDYDWFYFAEPDARHQQRAHRGRVGARAAASRRSIVRAAYKKGFTGSKVERLPSYWASKRNDDAFVVERQGAAASLRRRCSASTRATRGDRPRPQPRCSASIPSRSRRPGYYVGAQCRYPVTANASSA